MSWAMQVTLNHEKTDVGLQRDLDTLNAAVPSGNEQCVEERDTQVRSAVAAVFEMLADSRVFEKAEEITVYFAGHANKDHGPDSSYANEFIQINIAVKKYRAG